MIQNILLRLLKLLNIVLMTIPFAYCWYSYIVPNYQPLYLNHEAALIVIIYMLIYICFARTYDALLVSLTRISEMIYSQTLASLFAIAVVYFIAGFTIMDIPNPVPYLMMAAGSFGVAIVWAFVANRIFFGMVKPLKSAVIYDKERGMEALINNYALTRKFDVQFTLTVEECLENLDRLNDLDALFLSGVHSHERNVILKHCVDKKVQMYMIPRIGDVIMSGATQMHMFHLPILRVGRYNPHIEYVVTKRVFDFISSAIVLLLISPIMLATAIAIKMTDGGPVFYSQKRLTKDGEVFDVLKFRSMRVDAEKDGVARLSTGDNDDRITPVGHFIRKVRIDELPQLINIIKGDMSVVGPRPERPEIAVQYEATMPEFKLRLQTKAGLTGYAQVYGKYNTTPYDKLQMDLMYIAKPSFWEDLRIIFATIKILFLPESTEGVAEGSTTAMR